LNALLGLHPKYALLETTIRGVFINPIASRNSVAVPGFERGQLPENENFVLERVDSEMAAIPR
jgi:hypothetical protein